MKGLCQYLFWLTKRSPKRMFLLFWKKAKSKNTLQCLFAGSLYQGSTPTPSPSSENSPTKLLTPSCLQHLSIKLPELWTVSPSICELSQFIMCINSKVFLRQSFLCLMPFGFMKGFMGMLCLEITGETCISPWDTQFECESCRWPTSKPLDNKYLPKVVVKQIYC